MSTRASAKLASGRRAATARIPPPQSVERIFRVLDHLAVAGKGDTLAGIAKHVQAPKTSMVGLLAGMLDCGYLVRDGEGRYGLGPRMMSLAIRVTSCADLSALGRPVLADLVEKTGETALLGALAPQEDVATYIEKVESTNPVRYTVSLGERRELYSTAIGKLLLAHMDGPRRDKYLRRVVMEPFTSNTITSVRKLRSQLEVIRREGISRTNSERIAGASALAAPVLDAAGRLVVGITLAGPSERVRENLPRLERHLREAARSLGELIAGRSGATNT